MPTRSTPARVFVTVALLLLSAGWAANHFVSMMVVLRDQEGISSVVANAAYGIYALALIPCLLGGGILADRFGARPVVLTGGVVAALGNVSLLFWHTDAGLITGRFIVGLGVGLAVSAGTAWAGRLRGASGVTLAGICLTSGFAAGPIASSLLAAMLPQDAVLAVPFIVSSAFSLIAVVASVVIGDHRAVTITTPRPAGSPEPAPIQRSMGKALAVSLPMALWVFSCVATSLVILAGRASAHFSSGILLPGIAAALAFSAGLTAQTLGRKFSWGPASGVVGALFAAVGLALAGFGGVDTPLWVFIVASPILGTAYGLCLREGLLGVETYTPLNRRGTAIGVYYVFTYVGFGLPLLLDVLIPRFGFTGPLLVIAALALGSAALRTIQIRAGYITRA